MELLNRNRRLLVLADEERRTSNVQADRSMHPLAELTDEPFLDALDQSQNTCRQLRHERFKFRSGLRRRELTQSWWRKNGGEKMGEKKWGRKNGGEKMGDSK